MVRSPGMTGLLNSISDMELREVAKKSSYLLINIVSCLFRTTSSSVILRLLAPCLQS